MQLKSIFLATAAVLAIGVGDVWAQTQSRIEDDGDNNFNTVTQQPGA